MSGDLALLTAAARAAGAVAMRHFRQDPRAWEKPDGAGPVSEADLEVDAALRAQLTAARPDYGWLSEESTDTPARLARPRVFVIDPLDGTRAFLKGEPGFALSLAVVDQGRPVAGVVYLPAFDRLYAAEAGGPALRDGAPIRASLAEHPEGATVLARRSALEARHWPGGVPAMEPAFRPSLAHRMCLVAEGAHDAMLSFRATWEWDIAAGALIAEAAGAVVSDRTGAALRFNAAHPQAQGIMAAPAGLHARLLARMGVASAA